MIEKKKSSMVFPQEPSHTVETTLPQHWKKKNGQRSSANEWIVLAKTPACRYKVDADLIYSTLPNTPRHVWQKKGIVFEECMMVERKQEKGAQTEWLAAQP